MQVWGSHHGRDRAATAMSNVANECSSSADRGRPTIPSGLVGFDSQERFASSQRPRLPEASAPPRHLIGSPTRMSVLDHHPIPAPRIRIRLIIPPKRPTQCRSLRHLSARVFSRGGLSCTGSARSRGAAQAPGDVDPSRRR